MLSNGIANVGAWAIAGNSKNFQPLTNAQSKTKVQKRKKNIEENLSLKWSDVFEGNVLLAIGFLLVSKL